MQLGAQSAAWISGLTDPGIKALMTNLVANGSLSCAGALQLMAGVAAEGTLTAAEFADLQTIVTNLNVGITTSSYVASTLTQLVDGSSANATWTGGQSSSVTLGNLHTGSTVLQINELTGKWLLGSDLPNPYVPSNLDGQGGAAITPIYSAFAMPLFGPSGMPAVTDVNQGDDGTCVVCAAMIDMVVEHPNMLGQMIVNNGNGTYGVRFYINGQQSWVTVNGQLPTTSGGQLVNNNAYAGNDSLWADLIEKAYAQLSASGQIGHPAVNSYNNINGNNASYVLANFTGTQVTLYNSIYSSWNGSKQTLINDLAAGDNLIVGDEQAAGTNVTDSSGKTTLIGNHAFAVIAYDAATGDFLLRNPWGVTAGQTFDTQFEVSMADIASVSGVVWVDASSALPLVTYSAIGAIAAWQAGTITNGITLADSAADIAGNLTSLQAIAAQGKLGPITLTDGGIPTLTIQPGQAATDALVLGDITGSYSLAFTGAFTVAQAEALSAALLAKLAVPIQIADSAANISAGLDGLQSLVSAGKLSTITLTDLRNANLTLTAAQLSADAGAVSDINGAYSLNGAAPVLAANFTSNSPILEINRNSPLGPDTLRFVDNSGNVVGFSGYGSPNYQAFLWSGSAGFTLLNPLAGDSGSVAKMGNISGIEVGYSISSAGAQTPVQWSGGSSAATALTYNTGYSSGAALAVNARGDIAGEETNSTTSSVVLWKSGVPILLSSVAGASANFVYSINDSDNVAGFADVTVTTSSGSSVITQAITSLNNVIYSLPALSGDSNAAAYGINNANQVVGYSIGTSEHAVFWQNSVAANLGTLNSGDQAFAYAINNSGIIAGYDFTSQSQQAVLWVDGIIYNLNSMLAPSSGWVLQSARSVDDPTNGTVLVTGSGTLNGVADSFVMQVAPGLLSPNAAAATQGFLTGLMTSPVTVTDSAADIAANLAGLQSMATAGKLTAIKLSDGGFPTLALTWAQFTGDLGAINDTAGPFVINVSVTAPNQTVNSVAGHATMVQFSGAASQYSFAPIGNGSSLIVSNSSGADQLNGVTALQFSDFADFVASQTPALVGGVTSAQVADLYAAVLGRVPDVAGLAYYENIAASSAAIPITVYAQWFLQSPEYTANSAHNYAQTASGDALFVTDSYNNLLRRGPATGDVAWYQANVINPFLAGLTPGSTAYSAAELLAHAAVLADFSASAEFLTDVQVTAQHPSSASHWLILI